MGKRVSGFDFPHILNSKKFDLYSKLPDKPNVQELAPYYKASDFSFGLIL